MHPSEKDLLQYLQDQFPATKDHPLLAVAVHKVFQAGFNAGQADEHNRSSRYRDCGELTSLHGDNWG